MRHMMLRWKQPSWQEAAAEEELMAKGFTPFTWVNDAAKARHGDVVGDAIDLARDILHGNSALLEIYEDQDLGVGRTVRLATAAWATTYDSSWLRTSLRARRSQSFAIASIATLTKRATLTRGDSHGDRQVFQAAAPERFLGSDAEQRANKRCGVLFRVRIHPQHRTDRRSDVDARIGLLSREDSACGDERRRAVPAALSGDARAADADVASAGPNHEKARTLCSDGSKLIVPACKKLSIDWGDLRDRIQSIDYRNETLSLWAPEYVSALQSSIEGRDDSLLLDLLDGCAPLHPQLLPLLAERLRARSGRPRHLTLAESCVVARRADLLVPHVMQMKKFAAEEAQLLGVSIATINRGIAAGRKENAKRKTPP